MEGGRAAGKVVAELIRDPIERKRRGIGWDNDDSYLHSEEN
jgi:hypothetical protein